MKPDVEFYITNQIQNPVAQMFALAVNQLDGYKVKVNYDKLLKEYIEEKEMDEEEATLAVLKQKEKEIDSIVFLGASYLNKYKRGPMDVFLGRK